MKNEFRPVNQNWPNVTIDHMHICIGIQRSGPSGQNGSSGDKTTQVTAKLTFFETSWEGNSAHRNDSRKILFPQLKSNGELIRT